MKVLEAYESSTILIKGMCKRFYDRSQELKRMEKLKEPSASYAS
jgi:hypothetical protein